MDRSMALVIGLPRNACGARGTVCCPATCWWRLDRGRLAYRMLGLLERLLIGPRPVAGDLCRSRKSSDSLCAYCGSTNGLEFVCHPTLLVPSRLGDRSRPNMNCEP